MKVSILIPCHNAERWVGQAIESALAQTHPDTEVIVVDDGSTDRSLEIIQGFSNRIQWESTPNQGGNAARNRLLERATGEWVQYLDADDYLKPDKVATQLQEGSPIKESDLLYSPIIVEHWDHEQSISFDKADFDTSLDIHALWLDWRVAQTGAVLWRRRALESIGGWNTDFPRCQDNEVTLRALQSKLQIAFTPSAGAIYRVWSDNTVCHRDPLALAATKTALIDTMLEWLSDQSLLTNQHKRIAGRASFELARTLASHDLSKAVHYYQERQSLGLMHPSPRSSPASYRFLLKTLGFRWTEQLARLLRTDPPNLLRAS